MSLLCEKFDTISNETNLIKKVIPEFIYKNLNPVFKLRTYQKEALGRFFYYFNDYQNKIVPIHLLFNMATGSGKTLIMAALIFYLYNEGYRNFLFFVDSTNIIDKTKDNFLNSSSSKYLFNKKVIIDDKVITIRKVDNFDESNPDDINIVFTTIQGLHSYLTNPRENSITFEDFTDKKVVLISDEAHHINALTRNRNQLTLNEQLMLNTWEGTVNKLFKQTEDNILLEFTSTIGLDNNDIKKKYKNKIIYQYSLKEFRLDGYSKEIEVLQANLEDFDRLLLAMILSQYRRIIAQKNNLFIKPVVLAKSKTIKASKRISEEYFGKIKSLKFSMIKVLKEKINNDTINRVFSFFDEQNIDLEILTEEIKIDFSKEKCLVLDSKNIDTEKQLLVNSLEDKNNEIRLIFAVNMLNEGWDVLNLFDIVRLYNTRDTKYNRPGKTTIAEAQLIGRGARYYPFKLNEDQDPFKRKYDKEVKHKLKLLEELYYHSAHNPEYVSEIKSELIRTGIMPERDKIQIKLKVKESLKNKYVWKYGVIFTNKRVPNDKEDIFKLPENAKLRYEHKLKTGFLSISSVFEGEEQQAVFETKPKTFNLKNDFGKHIIREAINRNDFYKFNILKQYFPNLKSITEFIDVYLKDVEIDIRGTHNQLENLSSNDKLLTTISALNEISKEIKEGITDYKGETKFIYKAIKKIIKDDKILHIEEGREESKGMRNHTNPDLQLDLSDKDWYLFEEAFGTSEEKKLIKFFYDRIIDKLKEKYKNICLIRNELAFRICDFNKGRPFYPDFLLYLQNNENNHSVIYNIFLEPKGKHLEPYDKWKEDFLKKIKDKHKIINFTNSEYNIIGFPFYNSANEKEFEDYLKGELLDF